MEQQDLLEMVQLELRLSACIIAQASVQGEASPLLPLSRRVASYLESLRRLWPFILGLSETEKERWTKLVWLAFYRDTRTIFHFLAPDVVESGSGPWSPADWQLSWFTCEAAMYDVTAANDPACKALTEGQEIPACSRCLSVRYCSAGQFFPFPCLPSCRVSLWFASSQSISDSTGSTTSRNAGRRSS